jgi:hypoxanthine phosphoribosyltransferase
MHSHLDSVLFHETTILSRLDEMARQLTRDYAGKNLTVVLILHGSLFFVADLLRRVSLPLRLTSLDVTSYHGSTESSGTVTFNQLALPDVRHRHVLIVDDILDTGRTLATIRQRIERECHPESVRICVLLEKKRPRDVAINADYVGFEIGDEFVVGYGLDYHGNYRNLPLIGTLKTEFVHPGE